MAELVNSETRTEVKRVYKSSLDDKTYTCVQGECDIEDIEELEEGRCRSKIKVSTLCDNSSPIQTLITVAEYIGYKHKVYAHTVLKIKSLHTGHIAACFTVVGTERFSLSDLTRILSKERPIVEFSREVCGFDAIARM